MTNDEKTKLKEATTAPLPFSYSETNMRQLDLIPEAVINQSITIIGLGGIGSPTAYLLAKMGFKNLTLVDFDKVDVHNVSTQIYGLDEVDKHKTHALSNRLYRELGAEVTFHSIKANLLGDNDIVIMALDSMDERIRIWNASKEAGELPKYMIDARMGLEFTRIYAFSPYDSKDCAAYEKQLYPSSEAEQLLCTARAVAYNTFFISSIIASIVKKIVKSETVPFETMGDIGALGIRTFTS